MLMISCAAHLRVRGLCNYRDIAAACERAAKKISTLWVTTWRRMSDGRARDARSHIVQSRKLRMRPATSSSQPSKIEDTYQN